MLLTQCAACAVPLPRPAKQCSRCKTLYCGPACQKQHWEAGGHDELCKKIKKGGGAEAYNAGKKLKEAIAVAVENCADDTKGQTCYICTQALHWKTKEGLVRMCACRGTAGFAHVSCLAEQAKILMDEAEENNLGVKVKNQRWKRWYACSLCEQKYHGAVCGALGWACWKTYLGRPETDGVRTAAIDRLGSGLYEVKLYEDALSVKEAALSVLLRNGAPACNLLIARGNIAGTYRALGRLEEALRMRRDLYSECVRIHGKESHETLVEAISYANALIDLKRFKEARSLMREAIPVARRVLGESQEHTLRIRTNYARSLYSGDDAPLDDLREAVTTFEDVGRIARRVLGGAHPFTVDIEHVLQKARAALAAPETPSGSA